MNDRQIRKRAVERAELIAKLMVENTRKDVLTGLPRYDLFDEEDCVKNTYTSRVKYDLCNRCIHSNNLKMCSVSMGMSE